ncbi:MAG: PLP-dependent aminotransferase family protein, partial [Planctomycetota bacterium]
FLMFDFQFVTIDRRKKASLTAQVYHEIRSAILSGRLNGGTRIPSSRILAEQIGVSRTTILSVLDQLIAEGYLTTKQGSGTFVCAEFPLEEEAFNKTICRTNESGAHAQEFSKWSHLAQSIEPYSFLYAGDIQPFRSGLPALDTFPVDQWLRVWRQSWQVAQAPDLWYRSPIGCADLRNQVAKYLSAHRGVKCESDQVILMGGTAQILDLIARLMIEKGDSVFVENPGFTSARQIFTVNGATLKPLLVDKQGAVLPRNSITKQRDKFVSLTPSHQFPLGVTMSIDRRLEWLEWARKTECLIIEDDYDSEFRYAEKPVPAMQGLDRGQNVIYIGSFSKVVYPSLSMAYAVVPPRLCDTIKKACSVLCRPPSSTDQAALERFIRHGYFLRHVRRLRRTHRQRHDVFVEQMNELLSDKIRLSGTDAGLHCIGHLLSRKISDVALCARISELNLHCKPLSEYYLPGTPSDQVQQGLVMGFAGSKPNAIRSAIRKLAKAI